MYQKELSNKLNQLVEEFSTHYKKYLMKNKISCK